MTLSARDRTFTFIGILLALFLGALDQTIVSTALPRITEDLNGLSRYAWVATAYLLASTVLVPIYGKLADMISRRTIELWAIGLFLTGSALCGLAGEFGPLPILGDGMNQLIIFRAVQGLGGAGLFAMAFIIIADLFPPAVRGRYQGFVGAVFGVASVLGPVVGGFLTDYGGSIIPGVAGWRWVFYVNIPFGALALWFIISRMPPLEPQGEAGRLDYLSALFLVLGLTPFVLALQLETTLTVRLILYAVAAVSLLLFVLRSLRSKNPILDLSLFRNRVFSTANVALFFMGAAFLCITIFLPLFMVNVLGVSATQAGASLIPLSLGVVFGSVISGQLVSRFGHYKRLMLLGGVVLVVGTFLLSSMSVDIPYWKVTLYMVVCGLGLGPAMPLYTLAIQNAVDVRRIGQATSASQFFRQIGGTIGAALMGTVLATTLAGAFSSTTTQQANGGVPAANVGSAENAGSEGLGQGGVAEIEAGIRQTFDAQYALIEQVVRTGDEDALQQLQSNPQIPQEYKARLGQAALLSRMPKAAQDRMLAGVRTELDTQADTTVADVTQRVREAFTKAVTRIYFYATFIVVLGVLATLLIPELELRKTNAPAPASAAH